MLGTEILVFRCLAAKVLIPKSSVQAYMISIKVYIICQKHSCLSSSSVFLSSDTSKPLLRT